MSLLGEAFFENIAHQIFSMSKADQTEILISSSEHALTRFANSYIHQNVHIKNFSLSVRVILGKHIGVAATSGFTPESLKSVVGQARSNASSAAEDNDFISLPKPKPIKKAVTFSKHTLQFGSLNRARAVKTIVENARHAKCTASGSYEMTISELAIANSLGIWAYQPSTQASLSTVLTGNTSTGFASVTNMDTSKIDSVQLVHTAITKVEHGKNPITLSPGDYDVIIEAPAVCEMMDYFSYLAANGRLYQEQASFLRDKLGKKIFSNTITLYDDPLNPDGVPQSFDYEGYPKEKLTLVDKGVVQAVAYDSYTANKYKVKNTGHGLPAPNTDGPMCGHLVFQSGTYTTEELIKKTKKAILITRFWYVRMLHQLQLNITGMTRDGTFLIENGKIVGGIKNMRFTQSIPEALKNVTAVSKELTPVVSMIGVGLYPSLAISGFHFNSITTY